MKRSIISILSVLVLLSMFLTAIPAAATETTTVFADNFGVGTDEDNVTDWNVVGYADWDVDSDGNGIDAALRSDGSNGYLRLRSGQYVEKHDISTTGLTNIHLEYKWGQEVSSDPEDDGDLVVQWKLSSSGTWTTVNTHNLVNNSTTSPTANSVDIALGGTAANTSIDIRFWGDTDEDSDQARVDNVIVSGDPAANHTVIFNSNGGTGSMSNQIANIPTALTSNTFTRTGYSFSGWNTASGGGGTAYANGATYSFSADITLYAQWTPIIYTVTFHKNGGDTAAIPPSATTTYNGTVTLPTTNPTKAGYTFSSWNTASNGSGSTFTALTPVTASITVYAQYTRITWTITANAGIGGYISPGTTDVNEGDDQTFIIAPDAGHIVSDVLVDGTTHLGRINSYTFNDVTTNHAISASFDDGWYRPSSSNSDWTTPENGYTSDNSWAIADSSSDVVHYYDFNIPAIPAGFIINGIEVAIEGYTTEERQADISLSWNGTSYTTGSGVKTTDMPDYSSDDDEATFIFGGPSDTWNYGSWTPAIINSNSFRVRLDATSGGGNLYVDQVQVKIYYSPDTTSPTVTINQAASQYDPTSTSPINFTVVFSESVSGFATGDVSLSGTAGATTATVSGSGPTYTVAVTGMTGSGTVIADIPAGVAQDGASNPNTASTSTDNEVTYIKWPTSWSYPAFCNCDLPNEPGVSPDEVDLDGCPAVGYYFGADYAFFRERVDGDPFQSGNFKNSSWVVLFDTSGATPGYEVLVSLNGNQDRVELWTNAGTVPISWSPSIFNDPADTQVDPTYPAATYARRVTDSNDFFVDWAIPVSRLTELGIDANTTMYFATSQDSNNFNKDYLDCYDYPPAANPPITASCGFDVVLVVDMSLSTDEEEATIKAAANYFVDAFLPSESSSLVGLVEFSDSTASTVRNLTNNAATLHADINGLSNGGYTNWEAALQAATALLEGGLDRDDSLHPDLIVIFTDGDPTASSAGDEDTNQPNIHLAPAIVAANAAKTSNDSMPIRIVAVGINATATGATDRLVAISGPVVHPPAEINTATDVLINNPTPTSYQTLADALAALACNCDNCPTDPLKTEPGICGCGVPDTDTDGDGTVDCLDLCPTDPYKTEPGDCGCGVADIDTDNDGTLDCRDGCPADPLKTAPGICGCGVADTDTDGDGTIDCLDLCPTDPDKVAPGICGCGVPDTDSDGDGVADCNDGCPTDPNKTDPGVCGCSVADTDSDLDGFADCIDCDDANAAVYPGAPEICTDGIDNDCDGYIDCADADCPLCGECYVCNTSTGACEAVCTADAGPGYVIRVGESVVLGGAPTSSCPECTYSWTPITGLNDATLANPTASPASTTTYTVTVTQKQCTFTDTVLVTVMPAPAGGGLGPETYYLIVDMLGKRTYVEMNFSRNTTKEECQAYDEEHVYLLEFPMGTEVLCGECEGNGCYPKIIVMSPSDESLTPPEGMTIVGPIYDFTGYKDTLRHIPCHLVTHFDPVASVLLNFDPELVPEGGFDPVIGFYNHTDNQWVILPPDTGIVAEVGVATGLAEYFASPFAVLVSVPPPATPEPTPPAPTPAHFVASGLSIAPAEIKAGESVTISLNVANDGEQAGTYLVELKINGNTIDSKVLTLDGGQSEPVSFAVSAAEAGTYEATASGLSGSFTVEATSNWWIYLIIAAVVILAGVLVLLIRRRA